MYVIKLISYQIESSISSQIFEVEKLHGLLFNRRANLGRPKKIGKYEDRMWPGIIRTHKVSIAYVTMQTVSRELTSGYLWNKSHAISLTCYDTL